MKKVLLLSFIITSMLAVSCRQADQEEMFSPEDQANLKVLRDSANNFQARKDSTAVKDSTNYHKPMEEDPIVPPRK